MVRVCVSIHVCVCTYVSSLHHAHCDLGLDRCTHTHTHHSLHANTISGKAIKMKTAACEVCVTKK